MGQKTSKIEEKDYDLSEMELAKYRRIVAKYEQRRSKNEEHKNRKERIKSKKYKKPETIAEISDQGTIFKLKRFNVGDILLLIKRIMQKPWSISRHVFDKVGTEIMDF